MATKPTETLRITNQYRRRPTGVVCELEHFGARLSVHVWELGPEESGFRVETHCGSGPDAVVVGRSAKTRAEALRDVAASWAAERKRPSIDWEKVTTLLASVRVV
jgi:hypothetical protein